MVGIETSAGIATVIIAADGAKEMGKGIRNTRMWFEGVALMRFVPLVALTRQASGLPHRKQKEAQCHNGEPPPKIPKPGQPSFSFRSYLKPLCGFVKSVSERGSESILW